MREGALTARLALRIGPGSFSLEQITSRLAVAPTSTAQQDEVRKSAWVYEVTTDADDAIEGGVEQLRPLLERLANDDTVSAPRDLVMSVHAKSLGATYELRVEHLEMLSAIGAGVEINAFNGPDHEATHEYQPGHPLRALVSIVIWSESQSAEQITELVGVEPTRVGRKGDPVSRTEPDGPKRPRTSWTFEVEENTADPLRAGFKSLHPSLRRLAAVEPHDELRYVFVMLRGRDSGARHVVDASDVDLMAKAGTGLVLDVYNESDDG